MYTAPPRGDAAPGARSRSYGTADRAGRCGVLVNDHTLGRYLDEQPYAAV